MGTWPIYKNLQLILTKKTFIWQNISSRLLFFSFLLNLYLFVLERVREWELQIWSWCPTVGPEVAPLFTISFECKKKKKKKKKKKSWQVCDWLAKWLIMSGYMDLRRPRVYRRSNVGLVDYVPIIVSSWNFQELSHWTRVRSVRNVKVRGQRSRSQRSRPKFSFPDCNSSLNSHMMMKWYI